MGMTIYRLIILIPLFLFLGGIFIWIPWIFLRGALQSLIGRPAGFGWIRVDADVVDVEVPEEKLQRPVRKLPHYQYAVYEIDGEEHKMPLPQGSKVSKCKIYVKKDNPQVTWMPSYPDRFTALIGFLFIIGLWAGLIYAGFYIADMIRG